MAAAAPSTAANPLKRKIEDIIVDPETNQVLESSKKPRIELDAGKKYKCIKSIVDMYHALINHVFPPRKSKAKKDEKMDVEEIWIDPDEVIKCITTGNHITSIIFTIHNISRQRIKTTTSNMITKTAETSFKIRYAGNDYPITNAKVKSLWNNVIAANDLAYKDFGPNDPENWYGTMGPYLDMFSAFSLRVNELRLGHNNMPIAKIDGKHKSFPVSKYGLSGAHHVLLEGTSFPPERRSSIVQSIGPMTAWLCMLRSEGIYRKKYAAAVKRAMSHILCIDEIIEITKNTKQASEISSLTTLIAEILLITTARQATRMFFPLNIFAVVWKHHDDPKLFSDFFRSGAGGWYTYKMSSTLGLDWSLSGEMESEMASQIVFHGIFGTYKEDLSVLEAITHTGQWFTREQMGSCFRQQGTTDKSTRIMMDLPVVKAYSKMSCANQTGLLSGVYNQVATVPCFSGNRIHSFDAGFFEHIEKRRSIGSSGKSLSQIINLLTTTLEELHEMLRKNDGKMKMGTTSWRLMDSLSIGHPGNEVNVVINGRSKMFLGKNA